jgi:hypothetical protein
MRWKLRGLFNVKLGAECLGRICRREALNWSESRFHVEFADGQIEQRETGE